MEHIIKQLKKGAKHTRLSVAEKAEIKSALLRHVQMNPIRAEDTLRALATSNGAGPVRNEVLGRQQSVKGGKSLLSPFQINNLRSKKRRASTDITRRDFAKSTMPILVMLGLLMGGSASFAAENTVPGDMLYPIKVHVNEQVRGVAAVTPKAKAEWEVHLVERRLEEVEKLATKTDVSTETRQTAQTNLAEYTNRVKEHIAKFEGENDSEDAILMAGELADMLRTHEGVLAGLSTQGTGATTTSTAATTTAATVGSLATTTSALVASVDAQSLASVLTQLRADRGDAEKKHKELEHKYHPEVQKVNEDVKDDGRDERRESMRADWVPTPAVNATVVTTTSTTTTQLSGPIVSPWSHENTSGEREHEEIRATSATSSVPAATVTPAEHVESHVEVSKTHDTE